MEASARSLWARARDAFGIVATPLVPSHYVELVDPLRTTHVRHARIEAIEDETPTTRTLTLRPGRGWKRQVPGQFVKVGVEVDGRILTRTYSISSAADRTDGLFTITVTAIGRVSGALVHQHKPGDYVRIGLPEGEFTMRDPAPERVLFVSGGSGITPIMGMLRTFASRRAMPDIVHLHYARSEHDVIFKRTIDALALEFPSYRPTVVTTTANSGLCAATLDAVAPDWAFREAWACGPESLLDAASATIGGGLHVERFRPKLAPPNPNACGGRVRFGRSKRELDAGGSTPLLEIAERAGVDAPHGCRIGICHSCDATMVSGSVRDLRNGRTIDEPGARFQPCVCAAAGDVEIDL